MPNASFESDVLKNFEKEQAQIYDERFKSLNPVKDALHLATKLALEQLPTDAQILVVGAGTGAEILHLAEKFEGWRFTAVEPSKDMMEICRRKLDEAGFSARCNFHTGYLHELPDDSLYHAATSFLVSHFLTDRTQREQFFRDILVRLKTGGHLVTADLGSAGQDQPQIWEIWLRAMEQTGIVGEQMTSYTEAMKSGVALLEDSEMKEMLVEAGFTDPCSFFQVLSVRGWLARK